MSECTIESRVWALRQRLEALGVTAKELAHASDVPHRTAAKFAAEKDRNPRLTTLVALERGIMRLEALSKGAA